MSTQISDTRAASVTADAALLEAVRAAATVAGEHADAVDHDGRFPSEAIDALREGRALGAHVPVALGGAGASFGAVCTACYELSRRCAASGMIFAMHQIQVASIARHIDAGSPLADYLRELIAGQRLIASATSEVGVGGDLRRSIAALEPAGEGRLRFEKHGPTVSYGGHADDFLTTVRRAPDAEGSDQVVVLSRGSETELVSAGEWDTLGMRGTCSPAFTVRADVPETNVVPATFASVAAETMVPYSHILWAHGWLGLATDAVERAQAFVRAQARRSPGTTPPMAVRLSHLSAELSQLRGAVGAARTEYETIMDEPGRETLATMGYAVRVNNLKIVASEAIPSICQGALQICGMAGYKNGTPFSVGRNLRDSLSAALMIANERIHATNATLLLIHREG